MPLFIASLNSGSNGNAYYVGNESEAVLVDAGISCRETERRMHALGLDMQKVKGIFISHEHSDHITGLAGLSKKFQLPVYISHHTHASCGLPLDSSLVKFFNRQDRFTIGGLQIKTFPKFHDAADPHSFVISDNGIHVGVFTDIGHCCTEVIRHFQHCHAVFLESNYCDTMLEKGRYPYYLKKRIRSDRGHLSNDQALELFIHSRAAHLSHLILSHLSKNNNCPDLVNRMFSEHAGNTTITVASRYESTDVFEVSGAPVVFPEMVLPKTRLRRPAAPQLQLSLF